MSALPATADRALKSVDLVKPLRDAWNTPTAPLSEPYALSFAWYEAVFWSYLASGAASACISWETMVLTSNMPPDAETPEVATACSWENDNISHYRQNQTRLERGKQVPVLAMVDLGRTPMLRRKKKGHWHDASGPKSHHKLKDSPSKSSNRGFVFLHDCGRLAAQQAHHTVRQRVGLGQHCRNCLLQDLATRHRCGLCGEVGIDDTALRCGQVLSRGRQVGDGRREARLQCTVGGALGVHVRQGRVSDLDGQLGIVEVRHVQRSNRVQRGRLGSRRACWCTHAQAGTGVGHGEAAFRVERHAAVRNCRATALDGRRGAGATGAGVGSHVELRCRGVLVVDLDRLAGSVGQLDAAVFLVVFRGDAGFRRLGI